MKNKYKLMLIESETRQLSIPLLGYKITMTDDREVYGVAEFQDHLNTLEVGERFALGLLVKKVNGGFEIVSEFKQITVHNLSYTPGKITIVFKGEPAR